jgi:hypothetical protein
MKRQDVFVMRSFNRLEIHTAKIRSKATAPKVMATRL